ncbi:MAG: epoxyqueuosine reductase QueH [Chloroflexota bacterium]|nr:epoxyqueuosine reductase QueH [Chloroflexota bacterium]
MTSPDRAIVLDAEWRELSPTPIEKARRLVATGRATLVSESPFVVRLNYAVHLPSKLEPVEERPIGEGKSVLLHVCCAPCGTYTVERLRELGFAVTGFWYNPNIHPWSEHERRRETLVHYVNEIGLAMIWAEGYEMTSFLQAVTGHERFGERCAICYRMRLERTAHVAAAHGFDAITTTLLISPYQEQKLIRDIGKTVVAEQSLVFFFENFRRGWARRGHLAREHDLYQQRYCGCMYSEWEAGDPKAWTHPRRQTP